MKKFLKFEKLIGRWAVPITKDCSTRKELVKIAEGLSCETRFAKLKNDKWILVRKLTKNDLRSYDFVKYISTFKIENIKRLYK